MKLRLMSDLHLEFNPLSPLELDEDIVILAGDIAPLRYMNVPAWARRNWPTKHIFWVLGNHEHYGTGLTVEEGVEHARAQAAEQDADVPAAAGRPADEWAMKRRVHVLEEDVVYSPWGVRFLGCTLWTDFELVGGLHRSLKRANGVMNDFRGLIASKQRDRRFTAEDSRAIHQRQVRWLREEFAKPYDGKTVIITHHAPHPACDHPLYARDSLSPVFVSDLSALIEQRQPDLWISGHTHASHRVQVGKTLLISNQRGYSDTPEVRDRPFDPDLAVEI